MFKILLMLSSFVMLMSCGSGSDSNNAASTPPLPPVENREIDPIKEYIGDQFGRLNTFTFNSGLYQVMRDSDKNYLTRLTTEGLDESFATEGFQTLTGPEGILDDTRVPPMLIECKNEIYSVTDYETIHQLTLGSSGDLFTAVEIEKISKYTTVKPSGINFFCTDTHLAIFHTQNAIPMEWGILFLNLSTKNLTSYKLNFYFDPPQGMWSHEGKIYFLTVDDPAPQFTEVTLDEDGHTATLGKAISISSLANLNIKIALQNRAGVNTLSGFTPNYTSLSVSSTLTTQELHHKVTNDSFTPGDFHTFELPGGNFPSFFYNICPTLDNKHYGVFLNKGMSTYETSFFVLDTQTKNISAHFNEGQAYTLPQISPYDAYWGHAMANVSCSGNSIYFTFLDTLSSPNKAVMNRYFF